MTTATAKNGKLSEVINDKPAKAQIPKRIRRFINEAFDANAGSGDSSHRESVEKDKKEVLSYINGLLKQQSAG